MWCRDNTVRLARMDQPPHNNMEGHEEEGRVRLQLQVPNEATAPHRHHMQDYLNSTRASTPSWRCGSLYKRTLLRATIHVIHSIKSDCIYLCSKASKWRKTLFLIQKYEAMLLKVILKKKKQRQPLYIQWQKTAPTYKMTRAEWRNEKGTYKKTTEVISQLQIEETEILK